MANKNIFQTDIGDIGLQGASFIRQGVQDNSEAYKTQALSTAAKLIGTGIQTYGEAVVDKDLEEYTANQNIATASLDFNIQEMQFAEKKLQESQAYKDVNEYGVDSLTEEDKKQLNNLTNLYSRSKRAVEAGAINQTQHDLKVSSLVKRMQAERPWMSDYIQKAALDITGASRLYANPEFASMQLKMEEDQRMKEKRFEADRQMASVVAQQTGDYLGFMEATKSGDFSTYVANNQQALFEAKQADEARKRLRDKVDLLNLEQAELNLAQDKEMGPLQKQKALLDIQNTKANIQESIAKANAYKNEATIKSGNSALIRGSLNAAKIWLNQNYGVDSAYGVTDPNKASAIYKATNEAIGNPNNPLYELRVLAQDPKNDEAVAAFNSIMDQANYAKNVAEGKSIEANLLKSKYESDNIKREYTTLEAMTDPNIRMIYRNSLAGVTLSQSDQVKLQNYVKSQEFINNVVQLEAKKAKGEINQAEYIEMLAVKVADKTNIKLDTSNISGTDIDITNMKQALSVFGTKFNQAILTDPDMSSKYKKHAEQAKSTLENFADASGFIYDSKANKFTYNGTDEAKKRALPTMNLAWGNIQNTSKIK